MLKKRSWIIPLNIAILFGVLCFWAIQIHDTLWAVISMIFCLINAYFVYRWVQMRRPRRR